MSARTWVRFKLLQFLGLTGVLADICKRRDEVEKIYAEAERRRCEAAQLQADAKELHAQATALMKWVQERTTIDVDVSMRRGQPNTIILSGLYRDRAYVNVFEIETEDMHDLIRYLKDLQQWGQVRHLDAPPTFRALFERDF